MIDKHKPAFLDKVLDATPKWAMGMLGTLIGFSLCFITVINLADLKVPFNKYVDAQVTRITRAVDSLELVTANLSDIAKRVQSLEDRVSVLEKNQQTTDAKCHSK